MVFSYIFVTYCRVVIEVSVNVMAIHEGPRRFDGLISPPPEERCSFCFQYEKINPLSLRRSSPVILPILPSSISSMRATRTAILSLNTLKCEESEC